ncbi:heavy metal translocating P-type ATPase [Rikenella microfusus]|uniref:P-type Zn(2+) transporter n=1 Tax=Rikenella microfusus TaxID=28139 RepID=A0A379MQ98_9BACT|nr:Cadmium, zinc and cobalt-transporting ATPase [Rikenella microfusus]
MSHGHCNGSCCGTEQDMQKKEMLKIAVSFVLLAAGIFLSAADVPFFRDGRIRLVWYLAAYVPVGVPVLREAWETMRSGEIFSEFTLMSVAAAGAFLIGEYPEGVAVMVFYAVGELFQDRAVSRAKRSIGALLDVRPETAAVVREKGIETVSPAEVRIGETIEVRVGERVPLDGISESDAASFDTSALTGESVPRRIGRGEEVLAGMIATENVCRIRVARPAGESALSRILDLVRNAADRKAPAELFIRKFARIYTPAVMAAAALIVAVPWVWSLAASGFDYDFGDWLYRGLVFLVVSCPCALVVSVPLGYFGGIGAASRRGILFKGSNYLDAITKVNTVVMDKTGTLTKGVFEVQQVVPAEGLSEKQLLETVAAAEMRSNHPIARAIVRALPEMTPVFLSSSDAKEIPGLGIETTVNGKEVLAGNAKLLGHYGVDFPPETDGIPGTIVLCAVERRYAGYIVVADMPKEDARDAVAGLRKEGIRRIVMLSGDRQAIVSRLAADLGIGQAYGDLLPEGKVERIERLKADPANVVAFVGDGINDAPALALSDVGIAMGGLGSDVAVETADVIVQTDQPGRIPMAIRIGRATRRIVRQNIVLAFAVKLAVLALGAGGLATLWEAVFSDVGVSLLAVLNAVRIMRKRF